MHTGVTPFSEAWQILAAPFTDPLAQAERAARSVQTAIWVGVGLFGVYILMQMKRGR